MDSPSNQAMKMDAEALPGSPSPIPDNRSDVSKSPENISESLNELKAFPIIGDLVWAKMKGFSPWPGRVSIEPPDLKKPKKSIGPKQFCIFFFGTNNYAWIDDGNIKPYSEFKEQLVKSCKTSAFKDAVRKIDEYIINPDKLNMSFFSKHSDSEDKFNRLVDGRDELKQKAVKRPIATEKKSKAKNSPAPKKRRAGVTGSEPRIESDVDKSSSDSESYSPIMIRKCTATPGEKTSKPSTMCFGFLGLGLMGSVLVKCLLNNNHRVVVWNRSITKCHELVEAGAEMKLTPCDVIDAADVTFSCVTGPAAVKEVIFGNCGVLQASTLCNSKGYVEMSGIDEETSQDIAEAIVARGGRYLEAQIQGSKLQAETGSLVIISAGDRELFEDCQTCFEAIGKNSLYLGLLGNATKMNLVIQTIKGIAIAALAEGMSLADRCGLDKSVVLEVLQQTSISSNLMAEKGKAIVCGSFVAQTKVKSMQKDIQLSLGMADHFEQPLPLSAAANEIYKHAKRIGLSEEDVSSIYARNKR